MDRYNKINYLGSHMLYCTPEILNKFVDEQWDDTATPQENLNIFRSWRLNLK